MTIGTCALGFMNGCRQTRNMVQYVYMCSSLIGWRRERKMRRLPWAGCIYDSLKMSLAKQPRMWDLRGWTPEMEWPDVLHVVWLGIGRDTAGTICMLAARWLPKFQHMKTYDDRLHELTLGLWDWCKRHCVDTSGVEELSLQKLGVETVSLDYPLGYSKGWANKVLPFSCIIKQRGRSMHVFICVHLITN